MMTIKEFKEWFDKQFFILLDEKIITFSEHSEYGAVKQAISYVATFALEGKRFRPYLVYVGYTSEGGEEQIFPLYAAMELLHLFCLIQDDVMDNEIMRHDVLTVHRHFEIVYGNKEIARAIAILVGDILLAWAYECVDEIESIEPYTVDEVRIQFQSTVSEVIHGQLLDVVLQTERDAPKELLEKKMELKSARYSFFNPLSIGMILAGADEDSRIFIEDFAINLGMAFQLQDDITDAIKDVEGKQQTILSWYMRHDVTEKEQQEFETYFDTTWTIEDEKKLLKLLQSSGALTFAEHQAEEYFLAAEDAIFNHDKTGEEIWQEIIQNVKDTC